jgi:hypothetical protein
MTTAPLAKLAKDEISRIVHREYFIDLERNAYSWRIVAITHRLENPLLPAPAFFYPNQAAAERYASLPECCGDHIFSSPGDNDAEDIGRRCLTITPNRQSCIKVLHANLVSSVEQRIEES